MRDSPARKLPMVPETEVASAGPKERQRPYPPEKSQRLLRQMEKLERKGLVDCKQQEVFASVAMPMPKGNSVHLVAEYHAVHQQLEHCWPRPGSPKRGVKPGKSRKGLDNGASH